MAENEGLSYDIRNSPQISAATSNSGTELAVIVFVVMIMAVAIGGFLYWRKSKHHSTPGTTET